MVDLLHQVSKKYHLNSTAYQETIHFYEHYNRPKDLHFYTESKNTSFNAYRESNLFFVCKPHVMSKCKHFALLWTFISVDHHC